MKERVRFSTLMFLKESPPRLTKRSHLENILLLLMRCAVICLLAISFARPYIQRASVEPPKPNSGRRFVILLDTSASLRPVVKRAPGRPDWTALRTKQDLTPWAAAAIDATLLVAVDAFLVMLISWSSGIALDVLLRETGVALALFCAIPVLLYFLFFGGIAGSTLGQYVCHLIVRKTGRPLRLPDILRRTFGH